MEDHCCNNCYGCKLRDKAVELSWLCSSSMIPHDFILESIKSIAEDDDKEKALFNEFMDKREEIISDLFYAILNLKKMADQDIFLDDSALEAYGKKVLEKSEAFHEKIRFLLAESQEVEKDEESDC